ncbi:MAG: protein translocase subunit SecD [Lachnospiraceae bacterium]|nr:protein translocase subunit SecD [Lachnospiraceae bacterium]MDD7078392.1 protein translocase subunit SecD [Lachnospiraceae bacterium]MDY3729558.1 protein translocase subunit SecD [Candidatus Choladocola sp.]
MNKKKARIVLVGMIALLAVLVYTTVFGIGKTGTGSVKNIILGLDLSGGVSITYEAKGDQSPTDEQMKDTVYKLQQRVQGYSTEAQVYQEGSDRINIEIPGVSDANAILTELGKPGSLEFRLTDGTVVLTGNQVQTATAKTQQNEMGNREYVVQLELNKEGTEAFATATSENVGNVIEIVYDDNVISSPRVNEAITGGTAYISGMSSAEEAQNLASSIRIGSLSLELEEIRSNVVGAQLGEDAIKTSLIAGGIGIVIVMLFMIWAYALPGVVAAISLLIYVGLDLVLLNAFDMTLTLPGIAGIILSIGMAVDANVIIYARIREEISAGKSVKASIKTGFQKALSAILDGNITTLIAAFVLNLMGTGSVKGFAQTLALGIVLSMITALLISRLLVNAFYELGFKDEKYYGKAKELKTINFVGKKNICFIISLVLILVGPVSMAINSAAGNGALNLSMDFKGGTSTSVTFDEDMSIEQLDSDVKPIIRDITGDAEIQTQKVAGSNQVYIKTRVLSVDEREQVSAALQDAYGLEEKDISFETISSTVSNEMRRDAVVAVIIAALCMLVYIWFRFKDIRFAGSAVLALLHDVLVVFACYALVRISVGNTFIACMLTIVGYSINATIVIFDRIRENLALMKKASLSEIVNASITQTLTRSIYTTFTTFVMILVLYILGVATIKEFALPLIVGVLAGGYSSVCITGSLWYVMKKGVKSK